MTAVTKAMGIADIRAVAIAVDADILWASWVAIMQASATHRKVNT